MYACSPLLSTALPFNALPFLSLPLNEEQSSPLLLHVSLLVLNLSRFHFCLWTSAQEQMESLDVSFMWPERFIRSKLNIHME